MGDILFDGIQFVLFTGIPPVLTQLLSKPTLNQRT